MTINPELPVNKIAAVVVGDSYQISSEFRCGHAVTSMTPFPIKQYNGPAEHNLTGVVSGYFTVIGMAVFRAAGVVNTVRWVVKCKCGRYQMLTSKAVKKNSPQTKCVECRKTESLRDRILGKNGRSVNY